MRNYIPVTLWRESFSQHPSFIFVERVPLKKIKIDKRLFSWQNELDPAQVTFITENFDEDFWMPVTVNPDYYLLDGQHRLQVARNLRLKYIDVVIRRREKRQNV